MPTHHTDADKVINNYIIINVLGTYIFKYLWPIQAHCPINKQLNVLDFAEGISLSSTSSL